MCKPVFAVMLLLTNCPFCFGRQPNREADRLQKATAVMEKVLRQAPALGVPSLLLQEAVCVGIIPSEMRFAYVVTGKNHGTGALVCRSSTSGTWGAPALFRIGGPNYQLMLGGDASDVILLIMDRALVTKLNEGAVKFGVNATSAAGPVERPDHPAPIVHTTAQVLCYSRRHGNFEGMEFRGAVLKFDSEANRRLYGKIVTPEQILVKGSVPMPDSAKPLDDVLSRYCLPNSRSLPTS